MARVGASKRRLGWRDLHLWIGAGLFAILAPLGLTGSLLVWDDGLDKLLHPVRYAVAAGTLAPGAYIDAANRAFDGKAVAVQLRMPRGPREPVIVAGQAPGGLAEGQRPQSLNAWIDPATARVLDVGDPRRELRNQIHQLHGNLFMGQGGRQTVGWFGLAMLLLSLTGLYLWWPRRIVMLFKALRWTRSPSLFSNLHHMVGFWSCVPLAILSLTGAYISWPQQMRALTGQPPAAARQPARAPLAQPRLTADEAMQAALGAAGGRGWLVSLTLPTQDDKPAWRIQLGGQGGPVNVRVDDSSGKARLQPAAPQGDPIGRVMRRLHDGSTYGPVWQVIIAVAGVVPSLLGVTGIVVWLSRRRISRAAD